MNNIKGMKKRPCKEGNHCRHGKHGRELSNSNLQRDELGQDRRAALGGIVPQNSTDGLNSLFLLTEIGCSTDIPDVPEAVQ